MNINRDKFKKAALAKTVFNSCTLCYREIRASSLVGATDYAHEKKSKTYCSGRPSKSDFIADMDIACRAVTSRMKFDWHKFQLAYLIPFDLDDAQEIYVERIFETHRPVATDIDLGDLRNFSGNQTGRILKDRNRRARLENACGLEFLTRWGGGPKAYFAYQRRGINERKNSPDSFEIQRERLGADGESVPQSNDPAIQTLIESAFKYAESHGGMTGGVI